MRQQLWYVAAEDTTARGCEPLTLGAAASPRSFGVVDERLVDQRLLRAFVLGAGVAMERRHFTRRDSSRRSSGGSMCPKACMNACGGIPNWADFFAALPQLSCRLPLRIMPSFEPSKKSA